MAAVVSTQPEEPEDSHQRHHPSDLLLVLGVLQVIIELDRGKDGKEPLYKAEEDARLREDQTEKERSRGKEAIRRHF